MLFCPEGGSRCPLRLPHSPHFLLALEHVLFKPPCSHYAHHARLPARLAPPPLQILLGSLDPGAASRLAMSDFVLAVTGLGTRLCPAPTVQEAFEAVVGRAWGRAGLITRCHRAEEGQPTRNAQRRTAPGMKRGGSRRHILATAQTAAGCVTPTCLESLHPDEARGKHTVLVFWPCLRRQAVGCVCRAAGTHVQVAKYVLPRLSLPLPEPDPVEAALLHMDLVTTVEKLRTKMQVGREGTRVGPGTKRFVSTSKTASTRVVRGA